MYEAKKLLKGNKYGTMVVEVLTKHRQRLANILNKNRYLNNIDSFWSQDGKIFAKKTGQSKRRVVMSDDNLMELGCVIENVKTVTKM